MREEAVIAQKELYDSNKREEVILNVPWVGIILAQAYGKTILNLHLKKLPHLNLKYFFTKEATYGR